MADPGAALATGPWTEVSRGRVGRGRCRWRGRSGRNHVAILEDHRELVALPAARPAMGDREPACVGGLLGIDAIRALGVPAVPTLVGADDRLLGTFARGCGHVLGDALLHPVRLALQRAGCPTARTGRGAGVHPQGHPIVTLVATVGCPRTARLPGCSASGRRTPRSVPSRGDRHGRRARPAGARGQAARRAARPGHRRAGGRGAARARRARPPRDDRAAPDRARRAPAARVARPRPRRASTAPQAEVLIRAFSLYFQLANLAEEKQRVRRLRQRGTAARPHGVLDESIAAAVERARPRRVPAARCADAGRRAVASAWC